MSDESILARIEALVEEEHALLAREREDARSDAAHVRDVSTVEHYLQ